MEGQGHYQEYYYHYLENQICDMWDYLSLCNIAGILGDWEVKYLPAKAVDMGLSLGWEDPLEKEMATHFSILACEIPWTEEPTVHGVTKSWTTNSNILYYTRVLCC